MNLSRARWALGAVVVGAMVTGCGGAGDTKANSPAASTSTTAADTATFCAALETTSSATSADDSNAAGAALEEAGLPDGLSADAQAGYQILVDGMKRLTQAQIDDPAGSLFTQAELPQVQKFVTEGDALCGVTP